MALVSTADLRSGEFYQSLVVPALVEASVVLRSIRRIDTTSTKVNLPIVNAANIGWVAEGAALPDAGVNPDLVQVTPKKLAAYADITDFGLLQRHSGVRHDRHVAVPEFSGGPRLVLELASRLTPGNDRLTLAESRGRDGPG